MNEAYTPLREQMGGRKKVAIVGFCESSRAYTPYDDPDFEVWGLNRGALFMPRADRWFEMHGENIVNWQNRRPGRHVDWLNAFPGPVYMHQKVEWVRNSIDFPLKELADFFGENVLRVGHMVPSPKRKQSTSAAPDTMVVDGPADIHDTTGAPYLTSSIAYEIAIAIYEGFEEIHLYGVDLVTDAEYAWQKPGVEFLLGWAAGHGIKVVLPANCPLLQGTLYGRGYLSEKPETMSYEQLSQRMTSLQTDSRKTEIAIAQVQGALAAFTEVQAQMLPGIDHEKTEHRRKAYETQIQQLSFELQQIQGAMRETAYWIHQTMGGQEPVEAIKQLKATELVAEGPHTDLEEMQHKDFPENYFKQEVEEAPKKRRNGHKAKELELLAV